MDLYGECANLIHIENVQLFQTANHYIAIPKAMVLYAFQESCDLRARHWKLISLLHYSYGAHPKNGLLNAGVLYIV